VSRALLCREEGSEGEGKGVGLWNEAGPDRLQHNSNRVRQQGRGSVRGGGKGASEGHARQGVCGGLAQRGANCGRSCFHENNPLQHLLRLCTP